MRDLLMDQPAHDLDFVVEGDGPAFAARLARRLQGSLQVFERFGTAVVGVRGVGHVDVASARSEEYPEPGALPNVAVPAPLEQDLRRRDFTINALAIGVGPQEWGRLYDPLGGQRDRRARRLRIVHARSFRDDPNRLIRAAGFAGRFGLALEPRTERRLREAVAAGVLRTISADRRNETLRRLLRQPGAPLALALLSEWGLLEPLGLGRPLKSTDHRRLSRVPAALAALAAPTVFAWAKTYELGATRTALRRVAGLWRRHSRRLVDDCGRHRAPPAGGLLAAAAACATGADRGGPGQSGVAGGRDRGRSGASPGAEAGSS